MTVAAAGNGGRGCITNVRSQSAYDDVLTVAADGRSWTAARAGFAAPSRASASRQLSQSGTVVDDTAAFF